MVFQEEWTKYLDCLNERIKKKLKLNIWDLDSTQVEYNCIANENLKLPIYLSHEPTLSTFLRTLWQAKNWHGNNYLSSGQRPC